MGEIAVYRFSAYRLRSSAIAPSVNSRVKHVKVHGYPGPSASRLDLPSTGPCELLPRLDTATLPDTSETSADSSTTRVRRAVTFFSTLR
ncbi:hypothetical protein TNCT_724531 [Trichonephila clavata]|uniref:Uncharacterized protein n=1 Tax=Trichonephila clavata TaxID=2740835 RepID=A0A8X6L798_TRICU|nr:hypothetical protein TNCT_724531 [Trichonephila clavata]